jgi:ureidoglycolate amidohydrolase
VDILIDQESLLSELETLATISDAVPPAVTRIVFTPTDLKARAWLIRRFEGTGLAVRQDAIGNIFARWAGSKPEAPVVGSGSHIDAIPNSGKYDGVVGVLGALEAIRALQRCGFKPTNSIELLVFTSEEPTRFGIGCLGSRLLSGGLSAEAAKRLTGSDGESLEKVRLQAGLRGEIDDVKLPDGYYKAFVELHIEQGPLLEQQGVPLGIVGKIAAPASFRITIQGVGGHAGTVLMRDRRDALCAAAALILAIEHAARTKGTPDTVATVGVCEVFPGATNSIPSRVHLSLDIRDTAAAQRDAVMREIRAASEAIRGERRVSIEYDLLNADAPADCASLVVDAIRNACDAHGLKYLSMISRAYHDSLFMARIAPAGMLFIPCRNGHSHRPDEYASPEDIARGVLALAETLARLSA